MSGVAQSFCSLVSWSLGPFVYLVLAIASTVSARAHDPFEAWSSVIVHADHLELGVTMAKSTVVNLIDPKKEVGELTAENLTRHRPRLEHEAKALFVLISATKVLAAHHVAIELTAENDVVFTLTYPRPAPGRLHLRAAYLRKLGPGYGGIIEVADHEGHSLGWEQLSFENPSLAVVVPGPADSKK